jgi:hypothetical protein
MKPIITSIISFLAAFMLFFAAVYAWFAMSSESFIQPVSNKVLERDVQLDIEYGINGGGYTSFDEPAEINAFLNAMAPGDQLNIRITILNSNPIGDPDSNINIKLLNIRASETNTEYDLTDFFYLLDGKVTLTWYQSMTDYETNQSFLVQNIFLNMIDDSIINYLGYPLYNHRLNNLFNQYEEMGEIITENDIFILDTQFSSGQVIVVEFTIALDPYTPNRGGFQNGELLIDGLYSYYGD